MEILTLPLAYTNCYIIKGEAGYILVDCGRQMQASRFMRQIKARGISPSDVALIIITHAHFDHVGSLAAIKQHCSCPVMAHPREAELLEKGQVVIPPGTNRLGSMVSWLGSHNKWCLGFKPSKVELRVDAELDLSPYGAAGRVIPTPGHTPGSLSILLDDGRAMVGDLAMNFTRKTNYPIFAEQPQQIWESWQLLLDRGATRFYPAHGKSIPAERIKKALDCQNKSAAVSFKNSTLAE